MDKEPVYTVRTSIYKDGVEVCRDSAIILRVGVAEYGGVDLARIYLETNPKLLQFNYSTRATFQNLAQRSL